MWHNDGKHIRSIVDQTVCGRHNAPTGVACFGIEPETKTPGNPGGILLGICNFRAKKVVNGKISASSYQRANKR